MNETAKPRLVGLNHLALEVGDVQEALAFYRKIFDFELRGQGPGRAFIDIGDRDLQFTKAPEVLRGMHLSHLDKSEKAKEELAVKGLG